MRKNLYTLSALLGLLLNVTYIGTNLIIYYKKKRYTKLYGRKLANLKPNSSSSFEL